MQRYYTLIYNSLKMLLKNEKSLSVRQEKNSQVNHNYRRKSYATIKNDVVGIMGTEFHYEMKMLKIFDGDGCITM